MSIYPTARRTMMLKSGWAPGKRSLPGVYAFRMILHCNTNAATDLIDCRIVYVESETSVEEACDVSAQSHISSLDS